MDNLPNGWFSLNDITSYRKHAESLPDDPVVVELGVWAGRSICSIADILKEKRAKVYLVDTFEGTKGEEEAHKYAVEGRLFFECIANTRAFGLRPFIYPITTHDASESINQDFDMIFIDADHSYEAVKQDIEDWFPKLKKGGIIIGHDYHDFEGVKKAVHEYFGPFEVTDSLWHRKK